ncbi:hypothetical protein S40293_04840 [Stachybotrys chartarum IBT 40293]|nr:hypothetical protein S40293_04840 [Stachybotrys chartarum IBT 40293]
MVSLGLALLTPLVALFANGALGAGRPVAINVARCCDRLLRAFPDQTVLASNASYSTWNSRWADTAELIPSCVFRPLAVEDVSFAVKTLAKPVGNSKNHYCPFSIKGGGHTPWAGANNVDGGVAIDLTYLNQTTLTADRSVISLGGGTIWHDAYSNMDGQGVAFPGGRCPGTGVGGVTLGGGYSWFTGQIGFVADNIVNYEVVLASGDIVNANASSYSDLFRALKGGNNNFGVVTRFDLATIQHNQQVFGGLAIVPPSISDEVLAALQSFTDDSTGIHVSEGLTIEYFMDPSTGDGQVLLWLIDTDANGTHAALQPFFDMEPKLLNQVYQTSIADYPTSVPPVSRVLMADLTFVNDLDTIKGVYNLTIEVMNTVSHIPNLTWDFQFEPMSRHVIEASNAKGGNVMGLDSATEDLLVLFLMPLWEDAQYDSEVHAAAELWYNSIKEYTISRGKDHTWEFANYAAWFQDPMASYGPENLQFLQDVSRKYDPSGLFQKAVRGGYKLGL